jgi:hypothetical protein
VEPSAAILKLITDGGIVAILVLTLIAGAKRWWVWGWTYTDLLAERDGWKTMALHGTTLAEKAVGLADHQALR